MIKLLKMKQKLITVLVFLVPFLGQSQNSWFVKLNTNPRLSWSNDKSSKINPTNSISATVGYEFSDKLSAETGLYLNKVGYRLERTVEVIGVIDGFDSYLLEGEIPVKQKFTEQFIGIPMQINYNFLKRGNFRLFGYSNLTINIYKRTHHKWWYYYQKADEFSTDNTFVFNGKQKINLAYELGVFFEQNFFKRFSILVGGNYSHLFHESKFPLTPKKSQFFNVGGILGLRYDFNRK